MTNKNKVIWSEGMFLRPQHFQQERRYIEHLIDARYRSMNPYGWGFATLEIDHDRLASGQFALSRAEAVFADGAPVSIPTEDLSPVPIEIPGDLTNERVYLCLPTLTSGQQEFFTSESAGALVRYGVTDLTVRDSASELAGASSEIQVAPLRCELRLGSQPLDGYTHLGVAHIVECRSNRQVVLDAHYIPPMLDSRAHVTLDGFLNEVYGLLMHRAEELAGRVAGTQTGTAQTVEFVLLQAINRMTPQLEHLCRADTTHPVDIYRLFASMAGELATFATDSKRAREYGQYDHDNLQATFAQVMDDIRAALGMLLERRAVPIPLTEYASATAFSGTIADRSLIANARFVLSVAADLPQNQVLQQFPALAKIAAQEDIAEVVQKLLPGVPLNPLAVNPPQIPYHTGSCYFELDKNDPLWDSLNKTGTIAIHLGRKFEGLGLELWAIRG